MSMIRVLVNGARGRLGQEIMRLGSSEDDLEMKGSGRADRLEEMVSQCDVAIDVSQPEGAMKILEACQRQVKPLIVGSTGHNREQVQTLSATAKVIPLILAPNFSVGVNLLFWLTEQATKVLGTDFDVEIVEIHHRLKKDAPSGTAKRIGEIVAGVRGYSAENDIRHGRSGVTGERSRNEIGIHAVRAGDVVGEHTVYFAGPGERLELIQRSSTRETYARGALRAARWIIDQPPGFYQMQDVLQLG